MAPAIVLAAGGGQGFDAVVTGIESRYHAHAMRIPFMGLISIVAGVSTHGGVHGIHVAEIEHLDRPVDGEELNALVAERVGKGWQRVILETSRDGGEQSLIYMKPDGNRMGVLIVDLSGNEMDVVQVSVDPGHLDDDMGQFRHHHHQQHDSDSSDNDMPDSGESK